MPGNDEIQHDSPTLSPDGSRLLDSRSLDQDRSADDSPPTAEELELLRHATAVWEAERRAIWEHYSRPRESNYSTLRRFDLATLFVVTAIYALLLGVLTLLKVSPWASLAVAGLIPLVGIGQAILFRGRRPRLAAALVGLIYFSAWAVLFPWWGLKPLPLDRLSVLLVSCVFFGPLLGYATGGLIGGVFLLADALRRRSFPPDRDQVAKDA